MSKKERQAITIARIRAKVLGQVYFAAGDRVKIKNTNFSLLKSGRATIKFPHEPSTPPPAYNDVVGIIVDRWNPRLHTLGGHCKEGHGWWADVRILELYKRVEEL